jgi:hypothetical protein
MSFTRAAGDSTARAVGLRLPTWLPRLILIQRKKIARSFRQLDTVDLHRGGRCTTERNVGIPDCERLKTAVQSGLELDVQPLLAGRNANPHGRLSIGNKRVDDLEMTRILVLSRNMARSAATTRVLWAGLHNFAI